MKTNDRVQYTHRNYKSPVLGTVTKTDRNVISVLWDDGVKGLFSSVENLTFLKRKETLSVVHS